MNNIIEGGNNVKYNDIVHDLDLDIKSSNIKTNEAINIDVACKDKKPVTVGNLEARKDIITNLDLDAEGSIKTNETIINNCIVKSGPASLDIKEKKRRGSPPASKTKVKSTLDKPAQQEVVNEKPKVHANPIILEESALSAKELETEKPYLTTLGTR